MRKEIVNDQRKLVETIRAAGLNTVVTPVHRKRAVKHTGTSFIVYAQNKDKQDPENEILVVVACSSWEYYGLNSNGDGFPSERAYPEYGFEEKDLLPNRYKTFEEGQVYSMHDMQVAIGSVLKSFWNNHFKWVELVIEIEAAKVDEDTLGRIRQGDMIFFSMGCDVEHDVCTACGHKSFGNNYCKHVKDDLLGVENDVVVGMLNPSPTFDDVSAVFIPADAIAASLYRKTASKGRVAFVDKVSALKDNKPNRKVGATLKKIADIYKNTKDLLSIRKFKDAYTGITGNLEEGMKKDSLKSIVAFFFEHDLPIPAIAILKKYGLDPLRFLKVQDEVVARILRDPEFLKVVTNESKDISLDTATNIFEQVSDSGDEDKDLVFLIVCNLINKLKLSDKGVPQDKLPKGSPEMKDVKQIVQLEFLVE